MNKTLTNAIFAFILLFSATAHAGEFATPEEAKAMAEKASAYFKANNMEKLVEKVQNQDPQFRDRDLYVFIADTKGTLQAHGSGPKLKGRNLYNIKDVDGVFFVQEMIKLHKNGKETGWVDYKWANPKTKKLTPKTTYIIKLDDKHFLGVGAYKN